MWGSFCLTSIHYKGLSEGHFQVQASTVYTATRSSFKNFLHLGMGLLEGRGVEGAVGEVKENFLPVYLVSVFI